MSIAEKAALQASMQQHVDRSLVGGAYLVLNKATGEVSALHPYTAHPDMVRLGNYFVLCADFKDAQGNKVNVDFYMAQRGKSYVVIDGAAGQRAALEALMKAGKAQMID